MEKSTPQILNGSNHFLGRLFKIVCATALEWPQWWKTLSPFQKVFPAASIGVYWLSLFLLKGFRTDHLTLGIVLLLLSYMGGNGRVFLRFALPFFLTAIIYDSQRFYSDLIRGPVHVSEPYRFDKTFFGIQTPQGILTPNEWWQLHTHPALDFISGLAYLTFFSIFILTSIYFYFYLGKKGTPKISAPDVARSASRMPWAFLWVNLLGYSTYYWYAAAPPWYVALHGLGPAKMDTPANVAGCARFDQLLGTHFFTGMYGRSADVFGAIPSLHIAYPLLALLYSFQIGTARTFSATFFILMCFSAVYLNHHYVLDILWGSAYTVLMFWATNKICDQMENKVSRL